MKSRAQLFWWISQVRAYLELCMGYLGLTITEYPVCSWRGYLTWIHGPEHTCSKDWRILPSSVGTHLGSHQLTSASHSWRSGLLDPLLLLICGKGPPVVTAPSPVPLFPRAFGGGFGAGCTFLWHLSLFLMWLHSLPPNIRCFSSLRFITLIQWPVVRERAKLNAVI